MHVVRSQLKPLIDTDPRKTTRRTQRRPINCPSQSLANREGTETQQKGTTRTE